MVLAARLAALRAEFRYEKLVRPRRHGGAVVVPKVVEESEEHPPGIVSVGRRRAAREASRPPRHSSGYRFVMSKTTSIGALLNQIRDGHLALPDLQRDFVWEESQIRLLLDSIMRGYPFGALLFWNTKHVEVPYREFVKDFRTGDTFIPKTKEAGHALTMVLDGQQRLQSLYLAMRGTFDGRGLYFNIASGPNTTPEADEEPGATYRFAFWRGDESNRPKRFLRVGDILKWPPHDADRAARKAILGVGLEGDDADAAASNIRRLREVLNQSDLVPVTTIDEETDDAESARTIDEVLDIFVRVNSGGTRLTRSDLMFSLLKIKRASAREDFDGLILKTTHEGGLPIDKDFVIRGLLMLSDAPPSFDVDNVRRYWQPMLERFETFAKALHNALDFLRVPNGGGFTSAGLLEPHAVLFPVVYYVSQRASMAVPDDQRGALRAFVYFLLFNGFLRGRNPEARLRYIREVLKNASGDALPLGELLTLVQTRQRHTAIRTSAEMLSWHPRLALNIVQPGVCRDTLSYTERVEVDHIFPQSVFRPKHGPLVDDIGNFAFLGKLRNIRKDAELPADYFGEYTDQSLRDDFLIPDRKLLAPERFEDFVASRREAIVARVTEFLGR